MNSLILFSSSPLINFVAPRYLRVKISSLRWPHGRTINTQLWGSQRLVTAVSELSALKMPERRLFPRLQPPGAVYTNWMQFFNLGVSQTQLLFRIFLTLGLIEASSLGLFNYFFKHVWTSLRFPELRLCSTLSPEKGMCSDTVSAPVVDRATIWFLSNIIVTLLILISGTLRNSMVASPGWWQLKFRLERSFW